MVEAFLVKWRHFKALHRKYSVEVLHSFFDIFLNILLEIPFFILLV